uniref:Eukaryotic translation initiation factor 4E n=1 Tax=Pinguiococcus pyrenoidosus TaxID=172671 RepID=A0A7R9YAE5_9STRA|mmetsp:Transcript_14547/g.54978  ORF Transcript_14547/g.54978 Transcript_14547/m.54978 type:complete len:189 (+) Transcript_14547:92-658(+)
MGDADTHGLHRRWAWWCWWTDKQSAGAKWEQNLLKIFDFDTVEDFWALFDAMAPATRLNERMKGNYAVHKESSRPTWEDCEANDGGDWELSVSSADNAHVRLDEWWLRCLLALIGETFDDDNGSDDVLGVSICRRPRETRLCVRTRNADSEATQIRIGQKFREVCDIPSYLPLEYKRPNARKDVLYRA